MIPGAYNDRIGLQDFHAFSDLRSTQSGAQRVKMTFQYEIKLRVLESYSHLDILLSELVYCLISQ